MTEKTHLDELSYDECLTRLRGERIGRVAVSSVDGGPIVLPVNFRLAEAPGRTWVALRTRPGNVIEKAAPLAVAFEVDGFDTTRREGWSVLVRGTLHHVDPDAADFRMQFDPDPWLTEDRDAWLVIEPFAISGRRLRAAESEWPFEPDAYL
jgi:nitroimidazol reductase NimA-like FMN-containing flavoprotein (pyridoxamine 5'-phosphate oxidase superfamily)